MAEETTLEEDLHRLVDDLLPFAEKMLRKDRESLPFGGHVKASGEIVWEGAYDGDELPISQNLIDLLHETHKDMAKRHLIRACAVIYDVRTIPLGNQGSKTPSVPPRIQGMVVPSDLFSPTISIFSESLSLSRAT